MKRTEIERRHQLMMDGFQEFRTTIIESMDMVRASLSRGEYGLACRQLSAISQTHAQTSVNLRNALIRYGFLSRESEND